MSDRSDGRCRTCGRSGIVVATEAAARNTPMAEIERLRAIEAAAKIVADNFGKMPIEAFVKKLRAALAAKGGGDGK